MRTLTSCSVSLTKIHYIVGAQRRLLSVWKGVFRIKKLIHGVGCLMVFIVYEKNMRRNESAFT